MPIEGKLQTKKEWGLHLRTELATGNVGTDKLEVSLNIDNKALFIEIGDYVVTYYTHDMVENAIKLIEQVKAQ